MMRSEPTHIPDAADGVIRVPVTDTVFSTASEAFAQGRLPPFGSILADRQTARRGRTGRAWSGHAGNIHAAIRLPMTGVWATTGAAAAAALLVAEALEPLGLAIRVKWPNDLVIAVAGPEGEPAFAKAGGILLEESAGGPGALLVAGIGVNVAWAPETEALREGAALPAGRLADALGAPGAHAPANRSPESPDLSPEFLWRAVARRFAAEDPELLAGDLPRRIAPRLLWLGETVAITPEEGEEGGTFEGRLLGITPEGEAIVESASRIFSVSRGSLHGLHALHAPHGRQGLAELAGAHLSGMPPDRTV